MALLERVSVRELKPIRSVSELRPGTRYVPERLLTVDEFYELTTEDDRAELDAGVIVMPSPAGFLHENCNAFLLSLMRAFVSRTRLGIVVGSNFVIRLGPRTARAPDILFVRAERRHIITELDVVEPPDLVVEIIASRSMRSEALAKVAQYETFGIPEAWLVDLLRKHVRRLVLVNGVYEETILTGGDFTTSPSLPRFRLPMSHLFSEPDQLSDILDIVQSMLATDIDGD
jgi:Uma2 family endonuclease